MLASVLLGATLACGDDNVSPTNPVSEPQVAAASAALSFRSVSAGWDHTCAITTGTSAYCWGNNQSGQLGDSSKTRRLTPVPVSGGLPFDIVSAGNRNTCAVTTGHQAFCWGRNIPNGTATKPKPIDGSLHFVQVSAATDHFCGITTAGLAYCRGENGEGQLGDGSQVDRSVPVPVAGGHVFRQISASDYHTCAVTTDDRAYCWGDNTFGQVGDGTTGNGTDVLRRLEPTAVTGGLRFREIGAGTGFTCGMSTNGRAFCWGSNLHGQLGDETLDDRPTPTAVHGGRRFVQLAVGNSHVCGITVETRGYCWGRGAEGQLGVGAFDGIDHGQKPRAVVGGFSFDQITAGGLHSCGVTTGNDLYCWGSNSKGQLGNGTQSPKARPGKVS
jgi:alpha-tubulin suppressor-like RCC1 family protein